MKLKNIHIKNFRSIKDLSFDIDNFLCLIGKNNTGKSNIFNALDMFFNGDRQKKSQNIFCYISKNNQEKKLTIRLSFNEFNSFEKEQLNDWIIENELTIAKTCQLGIDGKVSQTQMILTRIPKEPWLRDDFPEYDKRANIRKLPIKEFIPERGRITRNIYNKACEEYIKKYQDTIEYIKRDFKINPHINRILDRCLPNFYLVPAISDITDETKTTGKSILSNILTELIAIITEENPDFKKLEHNLKIIKELIEGATPDKKLKEIKELEQNLNEELKLWNVSLNVGIETPSVNRLFQGTYLTLDDGIPTSAEEKGHGLQRSLIFALLRVWATILLKRTGVAEEHKRHVRSLIFAFEEPELYLHPQMCRSTYESLKQISDTNQVLLCTHSPHFIDMEDYKNIYITKKQSLKTGTKILGCNKDLFTGEEKNIFNMIRYFNPDRNEMFFADKVVLVEGATEKSLFPLLAKKIDVFDHSVSVIDCGGKFNLKLYMRVLNAFKLQYLVVHDEDPIDPEIIPNAPKYNREKYKSAKNVFKENKLIEKVCDNKIGKILMISGELEDFIGISSSQIENLGKPLAAIKKYNDLDMDGSKELQDIIREVYKLN